MSRAHPDILLMWRHKIEHAVSSFEHAHPALADLLMLMWAGDLDRHSDIWRKNMQSSLSRQATRLATSAQQEEIKSLTIARSPIVTLEQASTVYLVLAALRLRASCPHKVRVAVQHEPMLSKCDKIGGGSHANVLLWPTQLSGLKRDCAVKVCRLMRSTGPDESALIELMALSSLHRKGDAPIVPHVKQVIVDFESNRLLIVMKLFHKSLLDFFRSSSPMFDIVSIAQTLTYIMSHAHSMGIIHLDLKPANILVSKQNVLVVADWGLSRIVDDHGEQTTFGHKFVTVSHRPPELMLGWGRVGTYTDMWSLGCIVVELLAGNPVHSDWSEWNALVRITRTLGRPSESFVKELGDDLPYLRGDPSDSIILPAIPPVKAYTTLRRLIDAYATKMQQQDVSWRLIAYTLDATITWDWRERASAIRLNKLLFSEEPAVSSRI